MNTFRKLIILLLTNEVFTYKWHYFSSSKVKSYTRPFGAVTPKFTHKFNTKTNDCDKPINDMIQIGPNSKFLKKATDLCKENYDSWQIQAALCQVSGLELAEVSSYEDGQSLQRLLREIPNGVDYAIGINVKKDEDFGPWKLGDGTKILYSGFHVGEPNLPKDRCTSVWLYANNRAAWNDYHCGGGGRKVKCLVCQFKRDSKCFKESIEEKSRETKDQLIRLGATNQHEIYYGTQQKTWDQAIAFCTSHGMKLMSKEPEEKTKVELFRNWEMGRDTWNSIWIELTQPDEQICSAYWVGPNDSVFQRIKTGKSGDYYIQRPCDLPLYFLCEKSTDECAIPKKDMIKFQKDSKFFYKETHSCSNEYASFKEVEKICNDAGLDVAEISSFEDQISVQKFTREQWKDVNEFRSIPINVRKTNESRWVLGDGTKISFSAFPHTEPNKASESCTEVYQGYGERLIWNDYNCDGTGDGTKKCIACQYPKSSKCFKESAEEKNRQTDDLKLLGTIGNQEIYIGTLQKTWDEAVAYCTDHKMSILSRSPNTILKTALFKKWMYEHDTIHTIWIETKRYITRCSAYYADIPDGLCFHRVDTEPTAPGIQVERPCDLPLYFLCEKSIE